MEENLTPKSKNGIYLKVAVSLRSGVIVCCAAWLSWIGLSTDPIYGRWHPSEALICWRAATKCRTRFDTHSILRYANSSPYVSNLFLNNPDGYLDSGAEYLDTIPKKTKLKIKRSRSRNKKSSAGPEFVELFAFAGLDIHKNKFAYTHTRCAVTRRSQPPQKPLIICYASYLKATREDAVKWVEVLEKELVRAHGLVRMHCNFLDLAACSRAWLGKTSACTTWWTVNYLHNCRRDSSECIHSQHMRMHADACTQLYIHQCIHSKCHLHPGDFKIWSASIESTRGIDTCTHDAGRAHMMPDVHMTSARYTRAYIRSRITYTHIAQPLQALLCVHVRVSLGN